jgi:ADP-ribose pyrophosphatase YjhB (NUDIX family)
VVRELEEETGYQVEVGSLLKVDSELFEFPDVRKHIIRLMYRAKIVGGSIRHEAEGSTDLAAWHCVADLSELDLVPTAQAGAEFARP